MRIGVAGLGSMGRRRVRDLLVLGHELVGFDVRPDREREARTAFGIEVSGSLEELFSTGLEALVISTPPDEHALLYERSLAEGVSFFSEANVLTPRPEWLDELGAATGARGYPSATWRFYPPFAALRRELARCGPVLTVHHAYAGWLPAWHPWEPYDSFYAGHTRETCAAREMVPFELEWLDWVFGPVESVSAFHGARAEWRPAIDDTYLLELTFASGVVGTLVVELHQRAPFRLARISCSDAGLTIDVSTHELRRFDPEAGWSTLESGPVDFEAVYRAEIAAFAAAVEHSVAYPKSWVDDRRLSDVLVAAEQSHRRGAVVVEVADVAESYDGRSLTLEPARV